MQIQRHILTLATAVLLVVSALLTAPSALGESSKLSLELIKVQLGVESFQVADFDGDGEVEYLEFSPDNHSILAREFSSTNFYASALWQYNDTNWIMEAIPVEIDSLPGSEIALLMKDLEGDSIWVEIISGKDPQLLCRTEAIRGKNLRNNDVHPFEGEMWDGHARECFAEDLDNDGVKELIVPAQVAFDCYPRGLFVYDYPEGSLRWDYRTAGNPYELQFADANNDGRKEIYFHSGVHGNGCEVDSMFDSTEYVFALDYDGKLLWREDCSGKFDFRASGLTVCDCDNDGSIEAYYTKLMMTEDYDRHIRVLEKHMAFDNKFINNRPFESNELYTDLLKGDIDGDSQEELVLNKNPRVIDPVSLETETESTLGLYEIKLIDNIDGDSYGSLEVLVMKSGTGDSLLILNNTLKSIGSFSTDQRARIRKTKFFKDPFGNNYVGLTEEEYVDGKIFRRVSILKVTSRFFTIPSEAQEWKWVLIAFPAGLLLGAAIVVGSRVVRGRRSPTQNIGRYDRMLSSLMTFEHGNMAGRNLNRLAFLFGNIPESDEKRKEIQPRLSSAIEAYSSFTNTQLRGLAEEGKRFSELRDIATKLEESSDKLNLLLNEQRSSDLRKSLSPETKRVIPEQIEEIKNLVKLFRHFIQRDYETDLVGTVREVLSALSRHLRQSGVTISDLVIRGDISRPVFFSKSDLAAIIEELINNACDAMSFSTTKKLSIHVDFLSSEAILRISDTGAGLTIDDPDKLLKRDFTTKKEGGGYGLYHASEQVQKFGGSISLKNRQTEAGARVKMHLRLVSDE